MAEDRLRIWETLFRRVLTLIDSVAAAGAPPLEWSFGGGTVLMRRYRHRLSKDVDIFISDPQYFGYLSPRLNVTAESLTNDYVEQANFLKLFFREGEIDFVCSGPLTQSPTAPETLFDRTVQVETPTEIIAKKVWHRGAEFKARDIFDFALVAEVEPKALVEIRPVLRDRRSVVLGRLQSADAWLRKEFAELEVLEYRRTYDECVGILKAALAGE